jgi:TRAP transporter TAXI family solute receptor
MLPPFNELRIRLGAACGSDLLAASIPREAAMRFILSVACLLAATAPPSRAQDDALQLFTLGSGDLGGGYYAAAGALCTVVNRAFRGEMRCSPEPTSGSLYNLTMLEEGELDFAFAQSDWQLTAYQGGGPFADGAPMVDMRSVMALYPEMITIVAHRDAGITGVADLVGKRIDLGQSGSGRFASLTRLLGGLGLRREAFASVAELPTASAFEELCAGRIDATLLIIGHPNAGVGEVLSSCDTTLVPFVRGAGMPEVTEVAPGLRPAVIPGDTYPRLAADVPTYAVIATIVTRADTEPETVMRFVSAALDALPELQTRAPVLSALTPEIMRADGLTAPLHAGAAAAYAAAGAD